MNRSAKFLHGIWSGYMTTGVAAAVNLLTIPYALSVLGKPTFGLWTAVLQLTLLTSIFDLGLGPSLARFITDYKDHNDKTAYAVFLKSVFCLGALQGLIFVLAALVLFPWLPGFMSISAQQRSQFQWVLGLQLGVAALGFPTRPLAQVLYSNQQFAWINGATTASLIANGVVLVIGLRMGFGVYSYPAAGWAAFLVVQVALLICAIRHGFLPPMRKTTISFKVLKPLASFSANVFLIALGLQLSGFAPTLLITRNLGYQALADWAVGTKLMLFAWQLIGRIPNSSEPIFWEMFVRNEFSKLRERLVQLITLAGSTAALFGGGIVALNRPFVRYWTGGRVQWLTTTDVLLMLWVVILTAATVFNMVPGIVKKLGAMKYVYCLEGLVLIGLAYAPGFGWNSLSQVALFMMLCVSMSRFPYGLCRAWRDFDMTRAVLAKTLVRCGGIMLILLGTALALRGATARLAPLSQVVINGCVYALVALPIVYFFGLPSEVKAKAQQILSRPFMKCQARREPSGPELRRTVRNNSQQ